MEECGGKRSATPLWPGNAEHSGYKRSDVTESGVAASLCRSATALVCFRDRPPQTITPEWWCASACDCAIVFPLVADWITIHKSTIKHGAYRKKTVPAGCDGAGLSGALCTNRPANLYV